MIHLCGKGRTISMSTLSFKRRPQSDVICSTSDPSKNRRGAKIGRYLISAYLMKSNLDIAMMSERVPKKDSDEKKREETCFVLHHMPHFYTPQVYVRTVCMTEKKKKSAIQYYISRKGTTVLTSPFTNLLTEMWIRTGGPAMSQIIA